MNKPIISLIACIGRRRELGYENDLIWKIPEDLKYFRDKTNNHVVIMGQNTYKSIGRPLPNRTNIVLSDDLKFHAENIIVARSMDEALSKAKDIEKEEIFFIGGAYVYAQSIKLADKLYLTMVEGEAKADTYFPDFSDFEIVEKSQEMSYKDINYKFVILGKNG